MQTFLIIVQWNEQMWVGDGENEWERSSCVLPKIHQVEIDQIWFSMAQTQNSVTSSQFNMIKKNLSSQCVNSVISVYYYWVYLHKLNMIYSKWLGYKWNGKLCVNMAEM